MLYVSGIVFMLLLHIFPK